MDDPGTLIYVAFLVISLIAGWVRNKNKNAEKQSVGDVDEEMEMIDSKEQESYKRAEIEKVIAEQIRVDEEAKLRLKELMATTKPDNEVVKTRVSSNRLVIEDDSDDLLDEAIEEENEKFDARKAFIYSEIFNAPYI